MEGKTLRDSKEQEPHNTECHQRNLPWLQVLRHLVNREKKHMESVNLSSFQLEWKEERLIHRGDWRCKAVCYWWAMSSVGHNGNFWKVRWAAWSRCKEMYSSLEISFQVNTGYLEGLNRDVGLMWAIADVWKICCICFSQTYLTVKCFLNYNVRLEHGKEFMKCSELFGQSR